MLISCVLQCTDGLRLIKRLENYAYRMSEKTAYRSLEKSAYRSLKKLLTVHLQIHLTACRLALLEQWREYIINLTDFQFREVHTGAGRGQTIPVFLMGNVRRIDILGKRAAVLT